MIHSDDDQVKLKNKLSIEIKRLIRKISCLI